MHRTQSSLAIHAVDVNGRRCDGGAMTNHAFVMLVRTTPTWLRMPPPERFAYVDETLRPLVARHPDVHLRYFDAEAFSSRYTDMLFWETADVLAYHAVVEALRETLFWDTYFEIVEIVPMIEDAYATHYGVDPL